MASSRKTILCGICNDQEVIKPAVKWCPECDEGLCVDCEKHHRISRASRHHVVISIEDYEGLPAEISKICHHCEAHGKKFQMYCSHHDQPCCPDCISKIHNKCTELYDLSDVVKNVKTSSLLENIEQSLGDSQQNIEKIIKDREQNLTKIKEQRKEIHNKIKQKRDQINTHLDNLEKKLVDELDDVEKTLTSQFGHLMGQLKEKRKFVNQLQHNLSSIKSHASDLQTFLGTKHLEQQADQEEKYIRSLAKEESLQTLDLNLMINEQITDIKSATAFGSVTIKNQPTSISVQTAKDKQAQIMSAVRMHSASIDGITITLIRKLNIPTGKSLTYLTGCAIFPNGQIAFADCVSNKRIVITNDHGILQSEIFLSSDFFACDVTCLNNNSVAVPSITNKSIQIINTTSKTTTNTITTTGPCYGITNRQGTLIYCEYGKGIIQYQLDTKSSNTAVRQNITDWTYVASNENNIYHTNNESDTVTCYNLNGDKIWEFKDTSVLKLPYGVDVDKYSNVYVASNGNNAIVVISSDGKKSKQLLTTNERIENPQGLVIDHGNDNLLVSCYDGAVFLYKLSTRG